ncbi:MAG: hypothetical protein ABFR62_12035 [Bacteroidota bacterium]
MGRKDNIREEEFLEFIDKIELNKAPDGFTDKVMDKIVAPKPAPALFSKFWLLYGSLLGVISLVVLSSGSFIEQNSPILDYYFSLISNSFKNLKAPTFHIPFMATLVVGSIFILMLFDYVWRNREVSKFS